jgi:hypothetical protein
MRSLTATGHVGVLEVERQAEPRRSDDADRTLRSLKGFHTFVRS